MTEGKKYYLAETIRCMIDREPYGMKGDEVTLISTVHDPVGIVEDSKGERFPVHMDKLSEQKVEKEKEQDQVKEKSTKKSKTSKTKNIHQPLFNI